MKSIDTRAFDSLVGAPLVELIFKQAPTKVANRIGKSLDHFSKASVLIGVDEEMGAIRLIAAEEELVVAIFEWMKINSDAMPEHRDFVSRYKNHFVKLAFHPVLAQFRYVLEDFLHHGLTFDGLEDVLHLTVKPVITEEKIVLQLLKGEDWILDHNPLSVGISMPGRTDDDVIAELLNDFRQAALDQHQASLRAFVTLRADFRNKILYSEDGGVFSMGDRLEDLYDAFGKSLSDLLWCLAILLSNPARGHRWGLVSQFIALYRRVLQEAKLL